MNDAHHHGREPRPLDAFSRGEDLTAILADPAKPGRTSVSLRDCVRGDEPEGASVTQQIEGAPIEVGNEICVPGRARMQHKKPVVVVAPLAATDPAPSHERRVPHERIKPRPLPIEHLRELDLPVKGCQRRIGVAPLFEPTPIAPGFAAHRRPLELAALGFPLLRLRRLEVDRDREVTEKTDLRQLGARLVPEVASLAVGDALIGLPDAPPQLRHPVERVTEAQTPEHRRLGIVPAKRVELPAREPHERVAVPERVVDKRQRMVPGERNEPE